MERDGTWFPKKYLDNIIVFKILQEKTNSKTKEAPLETKPALFNEDHLTTVLLQKLQQLAQCKLDSRHPVVFVNKKNQPN
jgi:hypothetical protein